MNLSDWPTEISDVASQIAVLRNLEGGHLPETVEEFWRQLALDSRADASRGLAEMAEATAKALGIEFDDDYLERDTGLPALSLYEAVLAVCQTTQDGRGTASDGDLEEEGDDDVDAHSVVKDVPPTPWTIRETLLRINEGTLVLNPEWQRGFVWKLQKQRRLIESILLGLPIPSFLFFEDSSTGKIFVIDGRQRLETISHFMSPKEKRGEPKTRFRTFNSKTPGWGPGQPLGQAANKYYADLPDQFRLRFERAALVTFTFKDIPSDQLYQIFKRYNTGAVALNAAEIRNAVYQASPLHHMLFRLGGESREPGKYRDEAERDVGEAIRSVMPRGKKERYGAYDFIGRYFAFRHQDTGSVAAATNTFMQLHAKASADVVEGFRLEFIEAVQKTLEWYEQPLVEPRDDGQFHAMLGAIQLVSTSVALDAIKRGALDETVARERIKSEWPSVADALLTQKQNSTLFWNAHKQWNDQLVRQ